MSKKSSWYTAWKAMGHRICDIEDIADEICNVMAPGHLLGAVDNLLDGRQYSLWRHHTSLAMHENLNQ